MQQSTVITASIPVTASVQAKPKAKKVRKPVIYAEVHRTKLQELLSSQNGKIVGLDFVKLNGEDRMLNGRLGVRKHLAGGDATIGFADEPYLVLYDLRNKGYRAVNLATVTHVRAQNTRWTVIG